MKHLMILFTINLLAFLAGCSSGGASNSENRTENPDISNPDNGTPGTGLSSIPSDLSTLDPTTRTTDYPDTAVKDLNLAANQAAMNGAQLQLVAGTTWAKTTYSGENVYRPLPSSYAKYVSSTLSIETKNGVQVWKSENAFYEYEPGEAYPGFSYTCYYAYDANGNLWQSDDYTFTDDTIMTFVVPSAAQEALLFDTYSDAYDLTGKNFIAKHLYYDGDLFKGKIYANYTVTAGVLTSYNITSSDMAVLAGTLAEYGTFTINRYTVDQNGDKLITTDISGAIVIVPDSEVPASVLNAEVPSSNI